MSKFTATSRGSPCDSTAVVFAVRFVAKRYTYTAKVSERTMGTCLLEAGLELFFEPRCIIWLMTMTMMMMMMMMTIT